MPPTRIILNNSGDINREKELVPFALLRQKILHNLMGFQNLKQDQVRCELTDGSVVKVKSCFGDDRIEIYSPITTTLAPLIPCEAEAAYDNTLYFFVMNKVGGLYRVERYKVETFAETGITNAVYDGTVGMKYGISVNEGSRIYVLAGSTDTNSIIVQCKAMYINGVLWPWAEPIDGINDWWPGAQLRIPIEEFDKDWYEIFEMGNAAEYPADYNMGPGGNLTYSGTSYYDGFNVSNNIGGRHIMLSVGEDLVVYEHITEGGDPYPPVAGTTLATSSCICGGSLLIAVENKSSPYSGWYIGEWAANVSGIHFWDSGSTPFLSTMTRRFLELSEYDFYRVQQILYHDAKVYVFFNSGTFSPAANLVIKCYDFETGDLLVERDLGVNDGDFTRASKIIYQAVTYLCVATIDTWGTGLTSDAYILDSETLETRHQVAVPVSYFGDEFVVVNKPTTDTMVDHHNRIRYEWNDAYSTSWSDRLYYLGRSAICSEVAREHLAWLLSTGRYQHEDVNGDTVGVRALAHGLIMAGENLAIIMEENIESGIDYVCGTTAGWPTSPLHYANMVNREYNQIGWACGVYPETVTQIISGPGTYRGGEYTTEEEIIPIPGNMLGRVRVYVVVFAG